MKLYTGVTIPSLSEMIRQKRATNITLGVKAGVSPATISKARQGGSVLPDIAVAILTALLIYSFDRDARGAK